VVTDRIEVGPATVEWLSVGFEKQFGIPPNRAELRGLVAGHVRDEVLYREGLALGLDRDDPVIRSRIRLKMEVLGDGLAGDVSESDLQAWLDDRVAEYAAPPRYDFQQVFFDPARDASREGPDLVAALGELGRSADVDPTTLGDATLLPSALAGVTQSDVAAQFGGELADALAEAPMGRWIGPVSSAYGVHLVRIDARELPPPPTLADVREAVERDVLYARSQTASDSLYARLRARYTVRIEEATAGDPR